jgi:hypothetical protein
MLKAGVAPCSYVVTESCISRQHIHVHIEWPGYGHDCPAGRTVPAVTMMGAALYAAATAPRGADAATRQCNTPLLIGQSIKEMRFRRRAHTSLFGRKLR